MTFDLTGDTCALLLVGVTCAFGTVGHAQQSVRRMAKHTLKVFQEVSKVLNTSPNMRIWLFIERVVGEQYMKHSLFCKFLLLFFQLSHMRKDIRLSPLFPTLIDVKLGEACERG